jgi:hypothetical protein
MRLETQTKRLTRKGTVAAHGGSQVWAGTADFVKSVRPGHPQQFYRVCNQPILGRNRNDLTWPEARSNGSTLTPESVRKC